MSMNNYHFYDFKIFGCADDFNAQPNLENGSMSYDVEITRQHMIFLADEFDCFERLAPALGLSLAKIAEAKQKEDYQTSIYCCLNSWRNRNPSKATYRALIRITDKLGRGDISKKIKDYVHANDVTK